MSTLTRKSWQDIRRRWARSLFTVATIAVAVAGLGMFALPSLMDGAMNRQIDHDQLHDIRIFTDDVVVTAEEEAELRDLPGIAAVDTRTTFYTRLTVGDRREDARLVGVKDFANQTVNVVSVESGEAPRGAQALTDPQNGKSGRLSGRSGQVVEVADTAGATHSLTISGTGRSLDFSQIATEGAIVLYVPQETVNSIAGASGVDVFDIRVDDPEQAEAIASQVQAWLSERHPGIGFPDLPLTRPPGTWPGQDVFDNFVTLFYVGGVLALISAVALISNTMTTMVAEQRREIAIMKAIGGRRRQVALSFLRTAGMLAVAGSTLGAALGIPFSSYLARFIGTEFLGITIDWGIAWPVVIGSLLVGLIGTTLAAVPALRRGTSIPVREGLQSTNSSSGDGMSKALRRVPLPSTAKIGLRNITRRKARALGTTMQVGLAVGVALGMLALGVTVGRVTADTWDTMEWDVIVFQKSNVALDSQAAEILGGLDGVSVAAPQLYNDLRIEGNQYESWGIVPEANLYHPDLEAGRWLTAEDSAARAPVAVIGHAMSAQLGLKAGDTLVAESARGEVRFEIVGIDRVLGNNGTTVFIPFETFLGLLGRSDTNAYWLLSASQEETAIDRLAAAAEDALTSAGYPVGTEIHYVERKANLASNRTLVGVLAVMGVPIVAIGLIGLVNMMTMNVIERTREIGILRCLGARSGDVQGIFRSEALAVAALGWLLSVPLGWVIGKLLVEIVAELFDFGDLPYIFPVWYPPLALVATLVLAALVVMPPLRRASHLKPGDALRYE